MGWPRAGRARLPPRPNRAAEQRADDAGLIFDGHPHVQPGRRRWPARRVLRERMQQALAPRRVARRCARDQLVDVRVLPEPEHEALEDVADPARPALLAALDARERPPRRRRAPRAAGRGRAPWRPSAWRPNARAQRQACAAGCRPPRRGGRPRSRAHAGACSSTARSSAARSASSAAPVGFCPRGVTIAALAPRASAALQLDRSHAALVDGDRLERQAARAQQVEQRRIAGVLDGHAIAGAQVHVEHALDPVERAADDARRSQPGRRPRAGARAPARPARAGQPARRRAVRGSSCRASARSRSGSSAGSGLPLREIARARGDRQRRAARTDRRSLADAGAAPGLGDDNARGGAARPAAAATVTGLSPTSPARRRTEGSGAPGASAPSATASSTLVDQLRRAAARDPVLYWFSQQSVL